MLDITLLDSCYDIYSKRRIAKMLQNKAVIRRIPSIFPQGSQPNKIVLVLDDKVPYVRKKELKESVSKVLTGSRLDIMDFYDLIYRDDSFDDDGILYVVVPWLDFFLGGVKIFPPPTSSMRAATKLSLDDLVSSVNIPREFSYNSFTYCDYPDSAEFVAGLDPPLPENSAIVKAAASVSRRLIHLAQTLRSSISAKSSNSEVVFCGYPVTWMTTSDAEKAIKDLVRLSSLSN